MGIKDIKIKISSSIEGEETDLSVSELGVLFTAINRCFNQVPHSDELASADMTKNRQFDRVNYEPAFVELKVSSIKKGCIELDLVAKALTSINELPEPQRTLILGAISSGVWDISKNFGKHFARASKRVAIASTGKVISVAITTKNKTSKFVANFKSPGDVTVQSERQIPDDIQ